MTISLYREKTMASIAIIVASLGLGCGGGHNPEYILFRISNNSVNNEPAVALNQDFTVNIVAKNNTLLTYTTQAVTNAKYYWAVTDDSNKALQFYGQGSNEITITDTEIKIGKIKVSCKVKRGVRLRTDDKQFEVNKRTIKRLILQSDASNARASWFTDTRLAKTNEAIKTYIDKMKLGNKAASKYLIRITKFITIENSDSAKEQQITIFNEKMAITHSLMHESIIDESYNYNYPNQSLGYPTIVALEKHLYSEAGELGKNIGIVAENKKNRPYDYNANYWIKKDHMEWVNNTMSFKFELSDLNPDFKSELPTIQDYLIMTVENKYHVEPFGLLSRLDEWNKETELRGLDGLLYLSVLKKIVTNLGHLN